MESGLESIPISETKLLDSKAKELIAKFDVERNIPNTDEVIDAVEKKIEGYKLPEAFFNDEVNMALLIGCGQKLTESSDPIYKKRIENLIKRLVAPSVAEGTLDIGELWGDKPERGDLDEEKKKEYIDSKVDAEATEVFNTENADQILKAKTSWKLRGYDLAINTKIVSDDVMEFRRKTRAAGFINVPDKNELSPNSGKAEVNFVLLKGYSDKPNFVRHELYHVGDYWNFIRRGYQSSVFESLDELHTEYGAGNYKEGHSKEPFGDSAYFTLKQFWDDLSFAGDLDFNLIADRKATIETITKNFGFDGLVDFTLMHAHGDGKFTIFETFYRDHERPIMDMLISKGKISLRKAMEAGDLQRSVSQLVSTLDDLQKYTTPSEDYWYPKYKSIYDLTPSEEGKVYAASALESGNTEIPNEEAKRVVNGYAEALAFAEMCHNGEISGQESLYKSVINALSKIPHHREKVDFSPEQYVKNQFERSREFGTSDEEVYHDVYSGLYINLVNDMTGIDFAFSLGNQKTRNQILQPFLTELDNLAQHCVSTGNSDYMKWFVDGLYQYNMTTELRLLSSKYLKENFSELKPYIETRETTFDTRKISNFSF